MRGAFAIGSRQIGPGYGTYIVAEVSANHNRDYEQAAALVRAAAAAGADAVKLQTYTPDTLTIDSDRECFRVAGGTLWDGRTLYDLYGEAFTPWEWHGRLKSEAEGLGLDFFSTAFDPTSVEFLDGLGVPVHKIASFEIVDVPLIEKMARTGKPLIMSTGMATHEEIAEAVGAARRAGAAQIALLKCTSAYPAPPESMNLRTIPQLADRFGVPVGLSDHTLGIAVPAVAVALGACIVEKHFTLSRSTHGPDSAVLPGAARVPGDGGGRPHRREGAGRTRAGAGRTEEASRAFRRSLFVVADVRAGEVFTAANVRSIRPAHGLPPKHLPAVLGRRATRALGRGTPLSWELVEGGETGLSRSA